MNNVNIIGRLTRDPELRQIGSGTHLCKLSIAYNEYFTHNGERRENVSFFNVVIWGASGENANRYLSKGNRVAISGSLKQNTWQDQSGQKRSSVDIIATRWQNLEPRDRDNEGPSQEKRDQYPEPDYSHPPVDDGDIHF